MSAKQFNEMVNFQSGLLGVSETSSDMHDLLERETQDVRAAEAVALFCYQVKKWIGAFAAALGGLDTLVFAGGIGENAPTVRARICDGLGFLGIELEEKRNAANEGVISAAASRVAVRVIHTDEELHDRRDGLPRSRPWPWPAKKGIPTMRRNTALGWIRFRRAVSPHSEAASAGAIGVLAAVRIAVKPISQTRCQPGDNSEQNETQRTKGPLSC